MKRQMFIVESSDDLVYTDVSEEEIENGSERN